MVIKWHGKIDRNRITFWLRGSQNCRFVPFGNKHYGVPLLRCDAEFSENKNGRTEFHSMNVVHVKRQPKHFGLNQHTSRRTECVCVPFGGCYIFFVCFCYSSIWMYSELHAGCSVSVVIVVILARRFGCRLFLPFCFVRRNNEPNGIKKYFSLWIRLHCRLHAVDIVIIIDSKQHTEMCSKPTHTRARAYPFSFWSMRFSVHKIFRFYNNVDTSSNCVQILCCSCECHVYGSLHLNLARTLAHIRTQPNHHICQFKYNVFSHRQNWLMLIKSI